MPNPFLFGKIVTGKHFCNRENEQRLLEENLKGGQSVVIISPRRMGKSSLMSVVADRLSDQGLTCGQIDFFALKSVHKIVNETVRVCAEIMLRQEASIKRFLKLSADIFKRTRIAFEPSPDGSGFSIKPEVTLPVEIRTSISEAILGLDKFLGTKKKQGLIVLDEFQEILMIDRSQSHSLEAEFRTVIQSAENLAFAFLGSKATVLTDMFTDRKRPFFQAAKIMELGPIDNDSLESYIKNRFHAVGIAISGVHRIPEIVSGYPDYTQRLCSHLFDIISSTQPGDRTVSIEDTLLQQGLVRMIEACSLIFIPEFEAFPLRQQQVLSLLAEHGPLKRIPSLFLAEYEMSNTSFNTAVKELLRKGVVKLDSKGRYAVTDPVFRRWIVGRNGTSLAY